MLVKLRCLKKTDAQAGSDAQTSFGPRLNTELENKKLESYLSENGIDLSRVD